SPVGVQAPYFGAELALVTPRREGRPLHPIKSMKRARGQTEMKFKYSGKGGYREGAGRPKEPGAGVPHRPRGRLDARYPVHVTVRVRADVPTLRRQAFLLPLPASS